MKDLSFGKIIAQSTRRLGNPGVMAIAVALLTIGLMLLIMLAMGPGSAR